jgi:hypothetical protein
MDDPFDPADIKFNPSTIVLTTDYSKILAGSFKDYQAVRNVFEPEYNTVANIKTNGWGDACTLVGLSAADIKSMSDEDLQAAINNSQYRLPTNFENISFVGGPMLPVAQVNTEVTSYWKDWQVGSSRYLLGSSEYGGADYSYPNGNNSPLAHPILYTAGTPGMVKFPMYAQGTVAAGAYSLPNLGIRYGSANENLGKIKNLNTYAFFNGASRTLPSINTRAAVYVIPTYAFTAHGENVRCVAR